MGFLACPVALRATVVCQGRYIYLQSFVPTSAQKYRLEHTPDLTAFFPLFMKAFTKDRTLLMCPSENKSITRFSSSFFQFDSEVWIKGNTSTAIMKKPEVKSREWSNHTLSPLLLCLNTFPQGTLVIVLRHHLLFTIALFSSEIRLCLKVHSRLDVLQLRVTWSFHVISYMSNVIMLQAPKPALRGNIFT